MVGGSNPSGRASTTHVDDPPLHSGSEMGGMAEDEEMAIGVEPGQTKGLTVSFEEAGNTLAGCHVAGHHAGGTKATVTIE
jgi:uncharacterized cupredoxin-like copper-binding protein